MEHLKEQLNYEKETGLFTWKSRINRYSRVDIGSRAGHLENGYWVIKISGKNIKAHRLAWFFVYNKWPKNYIDHINGDSLDNRIDNLRDVTSRLNQQNRSYHRSGKKVGAYYYKKKNCWYSKLQINNKEVNLGVCKTEQDAHEMYLLASKNLDKFNGNPKDFRELLKSK